MNNSVTERLDFRTLHSRHPKILQTKMRNKKTLSDENRHFVVVTCIEQARFKRSPDAGSHRSLPRSEAFFIAFSCSRKSAEITPRIGGEVVPAVKILLDSFKYTQI